MISFACKEVKLEEIIKCSLELNKTEYNIFNFMLLKNIRNTTKRISKDMNLDRTTTQKALKKLFSKGLVERYQTNLKNGGYTFVYEVKDKENIKNKLKEIIKTWCSSAEKVIDNL